MRRHTQQSLLLCNLQLSIGLGHRPVCIPFLDWCPLFQIFVALRQELRGNKPTWQKEAKSPFLSKLLFLFSLTGQITGLPWWLNGKESPCDAEDAGYPGSVPGWGRFPGEGHGNPFGYSCLENSKDRGAWQATVHRVTKSQTQLKQLSRSRTNNCLSLSGRAFFCLFVFSLSDLWHILGEIEALLSTLNRPSGKRCHKFLAYSQILPICLWCTMSLISENYCNSLK